MKLVNIIPYTGLFEAAWFSIRKFIFNNYNFYYTRSIVYYIADR